MSWTASIHDGKPPTDDNLVAKATSTAKLNELPELAIEDPAFLADVSLAFVQAWEGPGPTGTGTVGEVQDMVHTMAHLLHRFKYLETFPGLNLKHK